MITRVVVFNVTAPENKNVIWGDTSDYTAIYLKHFSNGKWRSISYIDTSSFVSKESLDLAVEKAISEAIKTIDYNALKGKPSIGGIILEGDSSLEDLNIQIKGDYVSSTLLKEELEHKIDKEEGKGLLSDVDKLKLDGIESNANNYILPDDVVKDSLYNHTDNNFTTLEKEKLANLESSHFKGEYPNLTSLQEIEGKVGDYAFVDKGVGEDVVKYIWDSSDNTWTLQAGKPTVMTPTEVKIAYESNPDTNVFSDNEKNKLSNIEEGADVTPTLANVATSGDYSDLSNTPTKLPNPSTITINGISYDGSEEVSLTITAGESIPQVQVDWDMVNPSDVRFIKNKPNIPDITGLASENYVDTAISGIPKVDLSEYAKTEELPTKLPNPHKLVINNVEYDGSEDKTITITSEGGVDQIQSDWNQSDNTKVDFIKNKPTIPIIPEIPSGDSLVSTEDRTKWDGKSNFSGSYEDLTNKPTIPTIPSLATVAISGSYSDLINTPTIPSGNSLVSTQDRAAWDGKSDFSGNYSDLSNIPEDIIKEGDSRLTDSRIAKDVPAWAKASDKPNYTATEVGALPDTTMIPSIKGLATETFVTDKISKIPLTNIEYEEVGEVESSDPLDNIATKRYVMDKVVNTVSVIDITSDDTTPTVNCENNRRYFFDVITSLDLSKAPSFDSYSVCMVSFKTNDTLPTITVGEGLIGLGEYDIAINAEVSMIIEGNVITCNSVV